MDKLIYINSAINNFVWNNGVWILIATGTLPDDVSDSILVATAFNSIVPWGDIGSKFIAVSMFLFAFTSVVGWSHYGTKAWEYLFNSKEKPLFKAIHASTAFLGAIISSSLAWDISDTFNGFMMVPNVIAIIAMSGLVVRITKNYYDRKKGQKIEPMISYDPQIQAEQIEKMKLDGEMMP